MESYNKTYKLLHWGMALLVIAAIALVEFRGWLPSKDMKHEAVFLHIQAGLGIFCLIWVRIIWRATHDVPPIVPAPPGFQQKAAGWAHALLYLLMAALPFLGILALQSKGKDVAFLGWTLPALLDEDKWLSYSLSFRNVHETLGNLLMAAIAFHVLAALVHHFHVRDNTLRRMLPFPGSGRLETFNTSTKGNRQ